MPMLTSPHGENPIGPLSRAPRPASRTTRFEADSSMGNDVRARWPPYAPFCSDGIGLSVLPGASRLLGLAPVGCRRLTRSRVNVTAGRIILDAGCVVSAPLPALSGPPLARGHHSEGGGTFLSDPERSPSAVRGLLAGDTSRGPLFGPTDAFNGQRRVNFNSPAVFPGFERSTAEGPRDAKSDTNWRLLVCVGTRRCAPRPGEHRDFCGC